MENNIQVEIFEVMIPIVMFIATAVVFCVYFYLRHRTSQSVQETVRTAIEQGEQLTPEILARLGQAPRREKSDLRRAVIFIAVGLGIAAFGALVGQDEATRPMLAIGSLPFLVGVAYLGLWRFDKSE